MYYKDKDELFSQIMDCLNIDLKANRIEAQRQRQEQEKYIQWLETKWDTF